MKKKLYKGILVDIEVAAIPENQMVLSELSNKVLVVLPSLNFKKSIVYEHKIKSQMEEKQYSLDSYVGKKKDLKEYLYITRNLLNVYKMNEAYENVSCCFINEYINDNIDVFAEHEVRSIGEIQKIKG